MNKMVEENKTKKIMKETTKKVECNDKFCPTHGSHKLKLRGRTFEGEIVKKLPGRVSIQFERMISLPKYERYEKRKTRIQVHNPPCMNIKEGDLVEIKECRPLSKTKRFVITKKLDKADIKVKVENEEEEEEKSTTNKTTNKKK